MKIAQILVLSLSLNSNSYSQETISEEITPPAVVNPKPETISDLPLELEKSTALQKAYAEIERHKKAIEERDAEIARLNEERNNERNDFKKEKADLKNALSQQNEKNESLEKLMKKIIARSKKLLKHNASVQSSNRLQLSMLEKITNEFNSRSLDQDKTLNENKKDFPKQQKIRNEAKAKIQSMAQRLRSSFDLRTKYQKSLEKKLDELLKKPRSSISEIETLLNDFESFEKEFDNIDKILLDPKNNPSSILSNFESEISKAYVALDEIDEGIKKILGHPEQVVRNIGLSGHMQQYHLSNASASSAQFTAGGQAQVMVGIPDSEKTKTGSLQLGLSKGSDVFVGRQESNVGPVNIRLPMQLGKHTVTPTVSGHQDVLIVRAPHANYTNFTNCVDVGLSALGQFNSGRWQYSAQAGFGLGVQAAVHNDKKGNDRTAATFSPACYRAMIDATYSPQATADGLQVKMTAGVRGAVQIPNALQATAPTNLFAGLEVQYKPRSGFFDDFSFFANGQIEYDFTGVKAVDGSVEKIFIGGGNLGFHWDNPKNDPKREKKRQDEINGSKSAK